MGDNNNAVRTLVLVGRTGNGKSTTGNTILGRKAFVSKHSFTSVTTVCKLQKTQLEDGQIINVIDTPGLFDTSIDIKFISKEILKCIDLAKDGIHAVLVVFSIETRFSEEEAAILSSLRTLFGSKIVNYMIVIFTGGDVLEENEETLQGYLGSECPQPIKDILIACGNRMVLFDNMTKDESKRKTQVHELLSLVNKVINQNDGKPYTNEMFLDGKGGIISPSREATKQEISKLKEQMQRNYEDMLKRVTEMVETRLQLTIAGLEKKLAEAEAARKMAEGNARGSQSMFNDEISNLRDSLEKARRDKEDLRRQSIIIPCTIL